MGTSHHERPSAPLRGENAPRLDCFTLRVRNDDGSPVIAPVTPSVIASKPLRHCERSEAIQCESRPRLDCFGLRPRNDDAPPLRHASLVI
ncbi:MAG: hypothetical protein LBT00_07885, partial [Spirochaetaceae bacterium]|nr:hypothetical protein [Spirochaetaceae bacterium]